ncbi:MAG: hypothetical protein FWH06_03955, partial [Oscillospiraceae bacterium]|nr:hypothetical protein [Oscillospiraceae bacterium]
MKRLSAKAFDEIRLWIYRNARQIDLALWQYEFENGGAEAVLSALSYYQNEDGGFGNALEPDCWNPESSPYTTLYAAGKLREIGFADKAHPVFQGIMSFLESGAHSHENGWLFSIPSNGGWPRAPWWTYDPSANECESIGVSADIAGFALLFADEGSELYSRAFTVAQKLAARLSAPGNLGDTGVSGYCALFDAAERLGLADKLGFDLNALSGLVNRKIERDVSKWAYYGYRPSSFIRSPDSRFYAGNEDIVQKELDYLIDTRPDGGVWGITWSWFENDEKYQKEFAI